MSFLQTFYSGQDEYKKLVAEHGVDEKGHMSNATAMARLVAVQRIMNNETMTNEERQKLRQQPRIEIEKKIQRSKEEQPGWLYEIIQMTLQFLAVWGLEKTAQIFVMWARKKAQRMDPDSRLPSLAGSRVEPFTSLQRAFETTEQSLTDFGVANLQNPHTGSLSERQRQSLAAFQYGVDQIEENSRRYVMPTGAELDIDEIQNRLNPDNLLFPEEVVVGETNIVGAAAPIQLQFHRMFNDGESPFSIYRTMSTAVNRFFEAEALGFPATGPGQLVLQDAVQQAYRNWVTSNWVTNRRNTNKEASRKRPRFGHLVFGFNVPGPANQNSPQRKSIRMLNFMLQFVNEARVFFGILGSGANYQVLAQEWWELFLESPFVIEAARTQFGNADSTEIVLAKWVVAQKAFGGGAGQGLPTVQDAKAAIAHTLTALGGYKSAWSFAAIWGLVSYAGEALAETFFRHSRDHLGMVVAQVAAEQNAPGMPGANPEILKAAKELFDKRKEAGVVQFFTQTFTRAFKLANPNMFREAQMNDPTARGGMDKITYALSTDVQYYTGVGPRPWAIQPICPFTVVTNAALNPLLRPGPLGGLGPVQGGLGRRKKLEQIAAGTFQGPMAYTEINLVQAFFSELFNIPQLWDDSLENLNTALRGTAVQKKLLQDRFIGFGQKMILAGLFADMVRSRDVMGTLRNSPMRSMGFGATMSMLLGEMFERLSLPLWAQKFLFAPTTGLLPVPITSALAAGGAGLAYYLTPQDKTVGHYLPSKDNDAVMYTRLTRKRPSLLTDTFYYESARPSGITRVTLGDKEDKWKNQLKTGGTKVVDEWAQLGVMIYNYALGESKNFKDKILRVSYTEESGGVILTVAKPVMEWLTEMREEDLVVSIILLGYNIKRQGGKLVPAGAEAQLFGGHGALSEVKGLGSNFPGRVRLATESYSPFVASNLALPAEPEPKTEDEPEPKPEPERIEGGVKVTVTPATSVAPVDPGKDET